MTGVELDSNRLRRRVNDLAGPVSTRRCQAHVVLGKGHVHDGVVVDLEVGIDLGFGGIAGHDRVEEAHEALLVADGRDRGIVAACEAERNGVALPVMGGDLVDVGAAAVERGRLRSGVGGRKGEVPAASVG